MSIIQLDPERCVRQRIRDDSVDFNCALFGHS
jgi:hypothetical protein